MPHIHTEPGQHDQTASAHIVRIDGHTPQLLLHRHKILGVYLQFGGHIELNETPWRAVAHEVTEESGYAFNQLRILQPKGVLSKLTGVTLHPYPVCELTHEFSNTHFHTDTEYAFVADSEPVGTIENDESKLIRGFTRDELKLVPHDQIPENVREIGMFIFDTCLAEWEPVTTSQFAL